MRNTLRSAGALLCLLCGGALCALPLALALGVALPGITAPSGARAGEAEALAARAALLKGRAEEALAGYERALAAAGSRAPASWEEGRALAALATGALREAEAAAERAVERGGSAYEAHRLFVRGNIAWTRTLQAELAARDPRSGPLALDSALAFARGAERSWRLATIRRGEWPAARRNAERARAKIAELEEAARKRREAARKRRAGAEPRPRLSPRARPGAGTGERPEERAGSGTTRPDEEARVTRSAVSPEQVARLFEVLRERETRKRELRARRQREAAPGRRDY